MAENKRELEILFGKYKAYVYTICHQFTRSNEDALDLTQEVFLKVYKSIGKVKVNDDFKPWIRRITVNTCINYNRDNVIGSTINATKVKKDSRYIIVLKQQTKKTSSLNANPLQYSYTNGFRGCFLPEFLF